MAYRRFNLAVVGGGLCAYGVGLYATLWWKSSRKATTADELRGVTSTEEVECIYDKASQGRAV